MIDDICTCYKLITRAGRLSRDERMQILSRVIRMFALATGTRPDVLIKTSGAGSFPDLFEKLENS